MADFYWAPSGHPFRVELRFTTSASPSQEGSALFATDFPRYTRSRWTKKDRDRLGDRFVDESSRCVVPGELLQPLQNRHRRGGFSLVGDEPPTVEELREISEHQLAVIHLAFLALLGKRSKTGSKNSKHGRSQLTPGVPVQCDQH